MWRQQVSSHYLSGTLPFLSFPFLLEPELNSSGPGEPYWLGVNAVTYQYKFMYINYFKLYLLFWYICHWEPGGDIVNNKKYILLYVNFVIDNLEKIVN